jgi:hypothetical protein
MPPEEPSQPKPAGDWAEKDVFISYATPDREWVVAELVPALKANGVTYAMDTEHFPVGISLDTCITTAAKKARRTIAVITSAYKSSGWCGMEMLLLGSMDPDARHQRLLPIWLEDCELPDRIKAIVCADLRSVEQRSAALGKVIEALTGARAAAGHRVSLQSLADFFSQESVRQLAEESADDLRRVTDRLDALGRYKNLHEALHRTMDPRRDVEQRKDDLKAAQGKGWENIVPVVHKFVRELKNVCREAKASKLPNIEWTEPLAQAAETLPKTLPPAANLQLLCLALESTLVHLDTLPTLLNERIELTSRGLGLEELFEALQKIRARIAGLTLSAEAEVLFNEFQETIDSLSGRGISLPTFIGVHAQLQTITNSLRGLDATELDRDRLKWQWDVTSSARKKLRALGAPGEAFWFEDLCIRETALQAALDRPTDPVSALIDPFTNYIQTLDNAFTQTDCDLRELFRELNHFGAEVKEALYQMMIKPTP